MKTKVEWRDRDVWRSVSVDVAVSRNRNFTFEHDGKRYVFKERKQGESVLVLENGQWVKAGRVARSCLFLGPGISSDEYYATPEGLKAAQQAFQNFLANRAEP